MALDLQSVSADRIRALASCMRYWQRLSSNAPSGRTRGKQVRKEVQQWLEEKETRMTPWGIQYFDKGFNTWQPRFPHQDHNVICGRWIRDVEVPEFYAGHPRSCKCFGRPKPRITTSDVRGASSVLKAFRHGEETDPSLDIMEQFQPVQLEAPETERCLITQLPVEILDIILEHLIPAGRHTYHFLPVRTGSSVVQVIQKFVPEPHPVEHPVVDAAGIPIAGCWRANQIVQQDHGPEVPATGSVHGMSLAATSKHFQDIVYSRFYSKNAFIFHLTAATIHNDVQTSEFNTFRVWSRTTSEWPGPLGPLTDQAAAYIKDVTLIITTPERHESMNIKKLSELVEEAATDLAGAKLDFLSICFNVAKRERDSRHVLMALPVNRLQADFESRGALKIRVHDSRIEPVKDSNRTQKALLPLLNGPRDVKELVLSGQISDIMEQRLRDALTVSGIDTKRCREMDSEPSMFPRPSKRAKMAYTA